MMSSDRQRLVEQLIENEGLRHTAYIDTADKVTIGVGRNLTDVGLSDAEIMTLLEHDLDEVITDLSSFAWFPGLDPVRQRAVANLRFNVGAAGLRLFRYFLAAMARADYVQASLELEHSRWATQVQPARVASLRHMIETGDEYI
jgi:lysozyme